MKSESNPLLVWLMRLIACVIAGTVVLVYTRAIRGGTWPPGHPWSGISLSLLAISQFTLCRSGSRSKMAGTGISCLALLAAVLWSVSAR